MAVCILYCKSLVWGRWIGRTEMMRSNSIGAAFFIFDELAGMFASLPQLILKLTHQNRNLLQLRVHSVQNEGGDSFRFPARLPGRSNGHYAKQSKPKGERKHPETERSRDC